MMMIVRTVGTVTALLHLLLVLALETAGRLSNPAHCHSNGEGTWSIGIMEGKDWGSMSVLRDKVVVPASESGEETTVTCPRNPIIACSDVTDVLASFVADPFLFFPNGTGVGAPWYAFFEVKNMNKGHSLNGRRGQIGAAVSYDDGVTWTYLQIVLKIGMHLSYPHIVEHKGDIYMLPQGHSFRIFKSITFPTKWNFAKQLLSVNIPLQDMTTVYYQGRWWAFGIYELYGRDNWMLHIYYADDLLGPWLPTPNNCMARNKSGIFLCVGGPAVTTPHKRGRVGVRPGGRMFVEDGRLYRMVQDSRKLYGDGLHLFEVTKLSADEPLEERHIFAFESNYRTSHNVETWNRKRFHHADLHKISRRGEKDPRWVMLVDGDYNMGLGRIKDVTFRDERCADIRKKALVSSS